ncbi:MAG: biotin--[acetyl-CoA-carboxylase] ligase [Methanothrix sp.]|nr:biotin--[acetyl-CoA-carboxylase] ligase [Methanothrix sp.]NPU87395.1 biotin--[acetyl-CoA-carboxylase] ligase [Methanothrix sp.]
MRVKVRERAEDPSWSIIRKLRAASGGWVSGKAMGDGLGVSRAAVWKHIRHLRSMGYRIEASTRLGYRLLGPEPLHLHIPEDICSRLIQLESVGSTNEFAREIANEAENWTVVIAEVQTAGRGRLGRKWFSPSGGVWMSIILKPRVTPSEAFRYTMAGSVAVCRALRDLYGLDARTKWPNDVLVNGRKICGVLTEISAELDVINYMIIGIGINANMSASSLPEEWNATTIYEELHREVPRGELVAKVLEEMRALLESGDLYHQWVRLSDTLNRRVRVKGFDEVTGIAESLDPDGALVVRKDDGGIVRILAGDCIHLRPDDGDLRAGSDSQTGKGSTGYAEG